MLRHIPNSLSEVLERLFGIDVRALALTRVITAFIVLYDLFVRARHFTEHYGGAGVFPKETWRAFWEPSGYWSLHFLIDHPIWVGALFLLSALTAFALLIGYRTRVVTVGLFILTLSLHNTNPLVLTGGDTTLRLLLFLGIFLPWNRAYAVDEAIRTEERGSNRILTPWTAAYLLQIAGIYIFAGFSKFGITWQTGTAVYYALSVDYLRTAIGALTYKSQALMEFLTISVLTLQRVSFALFFSPFFTIVTRTFVTVLLIGMHVAFALHLKIGLFSWISVAALIPFLPSQFFDGLEKLFGKWSFGNLKIYYDGHCVFCKKSVFLIRTFLLLPNTSLLPAQSDHKILSQMRERDSWIIVDKESNVFVTYAGGVRIIKASPLFFWAAPLLATKIATLYGERLYRLIARKRDRIPLPSVRARQPRPSLALTATAISATLYIVAVAVWNISSTQFASEQLQQFSRETRLIYHIIGLEQTWELFAPNPPFVHGWVIPKITLRNGEEINVLHPESPLTFDEPSPVSEYYPDWRARKYFTTLSGNKYAFYRQHYLHYICSTVNRRDYELQVDSVELIYMEVRTLPKYNREVTKKILQHRQCV